MNNVLVSPSLEEDLSPAEMRKRILDLERAMRHMDGQEVEIEIVHHFAPGVYLREMRCPAGVTFVGKLHKTEHICILSQGKITVWTDEGVKTLEAPATIHSYPGAKRVGYCHTDVVWTNVHPTDETDVEKIEEQIIAKSFDEIPEFETKPLLGDKL